MNILDNKKNKNITFYLIHNNAISRIKIRKRLKVLAESLEFDLVAIFQQESLSNLKPNIFIKFSIIRIQYLRLFNLIYKFNRKISFKLFKSYRSFFFNISKFVLKIIFQNKQNDLKFYKHLKIEQIVTKKHISAWEEFLKTNNNIMIVFEDDALVKKDSKKRLKDLLNKLEILDYKYFFIDLAGGYNYKEVVPKDNILKINKNDIYIKGLYTNTACGYLMNRSLVEKLYSQFCCSYSNSNYPIDHLLNKLNNQLKNPDETLSLHFHNPIFTHGSFDNKVASWQSN